MSFTMKNINFFMITFILLLVIIPTNVYTFSAVTTLSFEKSDKNFKHKVTDTSPQRTISNPSYEQLFERYAKYSVHQPRIYRRRKKRATNQKDSSLSLTVLLPINNQKLTLDLILNKDLISKDYFRRTQENGTNRVQKFDAKDLSLCHYTGKVRNKPNSWLALSTCDGLSGVIYDGDQTHYIEKNKKTKNKHFLYSERHMVDANKNGQTKETSQIFKNKTNFNRRKRSIKGPWNANTDSRYVELVLVIDNSKYKEMNENLKDVENYCKNIANVLNALYFPLNIFIALVGVVVWTESDETQIVPNADQTLTNFLHYRRDKLLKDHPNDNAQLITKHIFDNGVDGRALKTPICTFEFSGGVTRETSTIVGVTANTIARLLGHNFGMERDVATCECPGEKCIMSGPHPIPSTQWSSCSHNALQHAYQQGMDHCLKNKPESLFQSSVCGNGFVEDGEECDCGLPEHCRSNCCNPKTCRLYRNATCATGECCNLYTCRFENPGKMCRPATNECDLPESCTGNSEFCPPDVYKMDSEICGSGDSHCYHGQCNCRSDQCRLLWGISSEDGIDECYQRNTKGTRGGNCGYDRFNTSYQKCNEEDIFCGMLQCSGNKTDNLRYGLESVSILSYQFVNTRGSILMCRTAIVDLGLGDPDPGMVPNGAKCGEDKMCFNQKCVSVASVREGHTCDCYNNGWCNNLRHCHCKPGYTLPYCQHLYSGGSVDSGPLEMAFSNIYNPLLI